MQCYACDHQATKQCRRCARVYCELHGGDLCAECMSPASSLPSFNLYRGSLLAVLVASAVALWLIVRPPGSGGSNEAILSQVTPTAIAAQNTRTPTAVFTVTPGITGTPGTPQPPASTPGPRPYVVQEGDTLFSIADQLVPPGLTPYDFAVQIAYASQLPSVDTPISPGQTLLIP